MERIVISGTGVFTPEESITNEELVEAYNKYAENYNLTNKNKIEHGEKVALELSNEEFIFNASGIKNLPSLSTLVVTISENIDVEKSS